MASFLRLTSIGLSVSIIAAACSAVSVTPASTVSPLSSDGPSTAPNASNRTAVTSRQLPGGATVGVDDITWALTERIAAGTYTDDTTDAFKEALERAGIAVVPDESTEPSTAVPELPLRSAASPMELLDFQAHALAVGAWAGAGWTGAELDAIVPVPPDSGSPSLSGLLAGYVASADTSGGAFARSLLAGQDLTKPEAVRFPAVVLILFVSDVATDGGRAVAPSNGTNAVQAAWSVSRDDVATICGGPSAWIDAIIGKVEHAISLAVPDNVAGVIIVGALNWLINIGASIVKTLVNALTAPVLGVIRGVAAIASGMAEQFASLLPYAVHVGVTGGSAPNYFLDQGPAAGSFDVHVTGGDLPAWPAVLATCAAAAGILLPDFSTHAAPLAFGPIQAPGDPLIAPTVDAASSTTTDADGNAHWPFVTSPDPGTGQYAMQVDIMPVAVHRKELDDLRAKLTNVLLGEIPDLLRPFVGAVLQPILDSIQAKLNGVLDARGKASAYIWFHKAAPATPSPSAPAAPSSSTVCSTTLLPGSHSGTLTSDSTTIVPPGQIDLGESGGDNSHGSASLTVTADSDGTLSGPFIQTVQQHEVYSGPAQATVDLVMSQSGSISGTVCGLVLSLTDETVTECSSTGFGTCPSTGTQISLIGLVPALPMGAPISGPSGSLTWSVSSETGSDAGFGSLGAEVQSTITVVVTAN